MTKETFEQATILQNQIYNIDKTLTFLSKAIEYDLEPMTRRSGFSLETTSTGTMIDHVLTEGEVVCIVGALAAKKAELLTMFDNL